MNEKFSKYFRKLAYSDNKKGTHDQEPDIKVVIDNVGKLDNVDLTRVTPNGKFLITYGSLIVGWNVEDVDDKGQLNKSEFEVEENNDYYRHLAFFSDNKKVVAIDFRFLMLRKMGVRDFSKL